MTLRPWYLLLVTACAVNGPAPRPMRCAKIPPHGATTFTTDSAFLLAGDYRVLLIDQVLPTHDTVLVEHLHLDVSDSVHRYQHVRPQLGYYPGERPVTGWAIVRYTGSADPVRYGSPGSDSPGVVYLTRFHILMIGDVDVMDGASENLDVQSIGPNGFYGQWKANNGIAVAIDTRTGRALPPAQGYFCAVRIAGA